jgi:PAS domain-containing protein
LFRSTRRSAPACRIYETTADRERFVASFAKKQLESFRVRLCRRDGRPIETLTNVVGSYDATGALVKLRGYLIDITASVDAESALLVREQLFRAVFFGASDAMMLVDDRRAIVDANPAAAELFGRTLADLTGEVLENLFLDEKESLVSTWAEFIGLGDAKHEHRVKGGPDSKAPGGRSGQRLVNAAIEPACTPVVTCASRGTSPNAGSSKNVWPRPRASKA